MKRLFALVFLVVFAACSGDHSTQPTNNNGGGGGGGGGALTREDTLRVATVRSLTEHLDQWNGLSADTIAVRASNYLKRLPSIKNAGIVDETTVWATFKDGVALIIPNNREASSQADTLLDDASIAPAPRSSSSSSPRYVAIPAGRRMMSALRVPASAREIPVSNKFRALNPIGTCHVDPIPVVKSLLSKGHYVDVHPGRATVEELATVRGEGVFYLDTHGGIGFDGNGQGIYCLWTATPFDNSTFGVYAPQLKDSELAVIVEMTNDAQGNCVNAAHIGITGVFVAKYMKFGKNSLVIADACSSASDFDGAADLRQGFANAGASVYVGWTKRVSDQFAYKAMKYLLDRLLGVNEISPEDPKQRAFNIDQVLNDMQTHRNLVDDPYKHAVLTVFHLKGDFGLLAPSIQFLSVDETPDQRRLIIAGLFGTDPGEGNREVTINDAPLGNVDWGTTEIDCDLPDAGSNASGTVVIKVGTGDRARTSNPVNLTQWKGEWLYERDDPGSQTAQMTISLRFRADIHSFRDEPGEDPFETTVLFGPSDDSKIEVTTGGEYSETIANCTDTYTLGQSGKIESVWNGSKDGLYVYFGSVDTKAHQLRLAMQVLAVFVGGTWKQSGDCENFSKPLYVQVATEDCLFDDHGQATAFLIPMNDKFTIIKDHRGPCSVTPLVSSLGPDLDGQAKISWNDIEAVNLPDPKAAR